MSAKQELFELVLNLTDDDAEKIEQGFAKISAMLPDQQENNARKIDIIERIMKLDAEQFEKLLALYAQQEQAEQARRSA